MKNSRNCSKDKDQFPQRIGIFLLVLVLLSSTSFAGEVLDSHVGKQGDHYLLRIDMLIDADPEQVRTLLTDYAHLDRLSPSITGSELLEKHDSHFRVRVTTYGCVMFFCRDLVQVQDVTELPDGYILVTVFPEMSDFRYSRNMWRIRTLNDRTRVTYSSDLVPDFWIPPLFGTSLFKNQLLEEARLVINNLEQLANLPDETVTE